MIERSSGQQGGNNTGKGRDWRLGDQVGGSCPVLGHEEQLRRRT